MGERFIETEADKERQRDVHIETERQKQRERGTERVNERPPLPGPGNPFQMILPGLYSSIDPPENMSY